MVPNDSTITIRLPRDIVEALDVIAAEDGVPRSLVVRRAVLTLIAARNRLRDARD